MSEYVFKTDKPIKSCPECDYRCGLNIIARKDQDGRHEDCPLVELPPHGRLIDADVMLDATRFWSFGRSDDYFDLKIKNTIIKAFLDTAPTVLEASEE